MHEIKIAAAYIRVSTEDQTEYSPDSQIKLIRDYAKRSGFIVPDEYVFEDAGISGRTAAKRPAFMRMISVAKEKPAPFSAILVWKFSRFARNQEESIVYKSLLKKSNGVDVISISEPVSDDVFGSLIERIIEWMDQFYSIRLSGEVKRGMNEKVSRGEPVVPPALGYDMRDKRYYPNESAATVRDIFASYLGGEGMRAIAQRLNAAGVRTTRGNFIDNRYIEYILHNPVYIGKIRWSTEGHAASMRRYDAPGIIVVDGQHAPIIEMDVWNAVQEKLLRAKTDFAKYARREHPAEWMLKGLCRCSACGATLCMLNTASQSMQCHRYAKGQCRVSHSITLCKANALVVGGLKAAARSGVFRMDPKQQPRRADEKADWARLIKAEERKLEKAKEAFYSGVDTVSEYKANKEAITENLDRLRAMLQDELEASKPFDVEEMRRKISGVLSIVESPDISESAKNSALRTVISRIVYNRPTSSMDIYYLV